MLTLRLLKTKEKTIAGGVPWVMRGEFVESSEQVLAEPGELCEIVSAKNEFLGIGYFNAQSHISCRLLSRRREAIDAAWFEKKFQEALKRRAHCPDSYYRLVHSEGEGLPGLVMDRFGDVLVVQVSTAGMERLQPLWMAALEVVVKPNSIVLRNDIRARELEGLRQETCVVKGQISPLVEVKENSCVYLADLLHGQKTGWFYDQRENRALVAEVAKDKTVFDVFSHSGGFGVLCAKRGATAVTMVDGSKLALELAMQAAERNGVASTCGVVEGDAFRVMERMAAEQKQFDIVIADPPAFVKSRKDMASGMKGYEKVARLAAALVAPGGYLYVASCSHHAPPQKFLSSVQDGVRKAGRVASLIAMTGHAQDHPVHPHLPQSEYLKAVWMRVE